MDESWFRIRLCHKIFYHRVIGVDNHFVPSQVGKEFFNGKHDCEQLLFNCCIIQLGIIESSTCKVNSMEYLVSSLSQNRPTT